MNRKLVQVSVLLCVAVLLAAGPALAAPPQSNPGRGHDPLDQMLAEGWQTVASGVLQRNMGGKKVETFAMGAEGFAWVYEQLRGQLGFLIGEYRKQPDPKIKQAIGSLKAQMARTKNDITLLESTTPAQLPAGCDFSYGAHANAYPTSPQGVRADADAYWNNNCGYSGDTYAYAYARATKNFTTTTLTQTNPRTGTNISSAATATVYGDSDCYSYSLGRVSSIDLGISYQTADENFECPAPPPTVAIVGPTNVFISGYTCKSVTWTSSVSGGTPPYTSYAWYRSGYFAGSGTSYSETFCGDDFTWTETVNLSLTVTDSSGQSGTDIHTTYINYSGSGGGCLLTATTDAIIPCLY